MHRIVSLLLLSFVAISPLFSQENQDEILLMSGNVLNAKIDTLDSLNLYYVITTKSGKEKAKSVELDRVFSYTEVAGKEKVIYVMNEEYGNDLSVAEMRDYIKGEQDAQKVHGSNWVWFVVTPVSAAGTYALARSSVAAFAVPPATMVLSLIPPYKVKKEKVDLKDVEYPDAYSMGYQRAAKGKRVVKATFAALIGGAVGIIALSATAE